MSKQDLSPRVSQRDKLKTPLKLKEFNWTPKQKEFIELACNKSSRIIFVNGPAGSAKTALSVYSALRLLNEKRVSDIIYVRSAVESSDSRLGFLPGDVEQKLHFFNLPFYDKLEEFLDKADIDKLQKEKRISMYPVNFSRGMSWNVKCIIMDEVQNSSLKEIITLLTRLGKYTKCFVLADPFQTDLNNGKAGAFSKIVPLFNDDEAREHGIYHFEFTKDDIVRDELVKFLVTRFERLVP